MGWNETPGGSNKDPWGRKGSGNEGPPDLDEIVRKMQQGFGGIFGKRPAGASGGNGSPYTWVLVFVALLGWLVYDIAYIIDQQERGLVLRFGKYITTLQPGLNFRLPRPVENVIIINVGQVRSITHRANMLTQDENIVDVELAVQWRIKEPTDFQFNVYSPESTLHQSAESAVREVIGKSALDFVLTEGRSQIAQSQHRLIQQIMDDYSTGIEILGVEMQPAKPPEEVKAAFDDAIKAREDEQRLVNEAEAYRNDIIPRARGSAARMREEANAYKSRVIAKSEGEASRFEQLLVQYEQAPDVTRQRLYLDTIESVFSGTNKVLLDTEGGNNLMYIPIDKIMEQRRYEEQGSSTSGEYNPSVSGGSPATDTGTGFMDRSRGMR